MQQQVQTATHLHPHIAATGQCAKRLVHVRRTQRPLLLAHASSNEHAASSSAAPLHQQLLGGVRSAASRVDPRQLLGRLKEKQQQQQHDINIAHPAPVAAGQAAASDVQGAAGFPAQLLRLVGDVARAVPGAQQSGPHASHINAGSVNHHPAAAPAAEGSGSFAVVSGHQLDLVRHSLWSSEAAAATAAVPPANEGDWGVQPSVLDWSSAQTGSSSSSSTRTLQETPPDPSAAALSTPANLPEAAAPPSSSSSSSGLRFAKHLATLSNGCAPPSSRLESLGWLLFESQRQQAALGLGPPAAAAAPGASGSSSSSDEALARQAQQWLATAESRRLLEQVRIASAAIALTGHDFMALNATMPPCLRSIGCIHCSCWNFAEHLQHCKSAFTLP